MSIHIGTSGWSYDHWTGVLYPEGTGRYDRLGYYIARFQTVELNASFYRWPRLSAFASWRRRLPPGFVLTVKAPRGLTHARRLYGPEPWLPRLDEAFRTLGPTAGPLLVQLPPGLALDLPRLEYFLHVLPPGIQAAIEFRHPTWHTEETYALLERFGAAYVVMSGAGLPCVLRVTAPFAYVRLHGPDHGWLYAGSYSDDDLRWWADRIHEWSDQGRAVYAYFNNDGNGYAVYNALRLRELVGA